MPTQISLKKTEARTELKKFKDNKISLKRDVFFVPGWTDQACICWTEPYMESGVDRRAGWEYTIKDWEYIVENSEKMHYLQLVENDKAINITRDNQGKIKNITFDSDLTYDYTSFFQFAELIKSKIRATGVNEFDLVGHSMGGLDIISAVALNKEDDYPEVKGLIKTDPLDGVGLVVTVATPYKGSGPANLVKHTPIDEIFRPGWSEGVRKQCENMAYDSAFIKIINQNEIRTKLLKNAKVGVHTFSGENDGAVTSQDAFIDDANNHAPFELVMHSQRMGITQDPRLHFALFNLFIS
ncbi:MAG: alpha/beta hydrolase [Candidatus Omnitrophota bacterium]